MAENTEAAESLGVVDSPSYIPSPRQRPLRTLRTTSILSFPDMKNEPQKLRVLIAANGQRDIAKAEALVVRFSNHPKIETRVICDHVTTRVQRTTIAYDNRSLEGIVVENGEEEQEDIDRYFKTAYQMCEWADLLVLAPIDANTFAKMLHGMTGNLILEVLRGWDVSKKIILVPGMTTLMWENPMTKKQLNKVRRKWNWVRVMSPILWQYDDKLPSKCHVTWDGFSELIEVIKNQAELMTIGHDVDIAAAGAADAKRNLKTDTILPPEIWSLIFEHVADWEVARSLGVYTNLPRPAEWKPRGGLDAKDELYCYMRELEWTILTKPVSAVITKLSTAPKSMLYLSGLCVKLIIKFCLTDLLAHLEIHFKEVFWQSFGSKLLPTKASAVYGRTEILEWWRTSPSFLKKDYTVEAIDGASKSGFVHVLDWWRKSGLPLKYSEAALEQASSKGHILVLEWWKEASMHQGSYYIESDSSKHNTTGQRHRHNSPGPLNVHSSSPAAPTDSGPTTVETPPLRLKVGKSIMAAAQNGQAATIRWWDTSGIPYSHSEAVAKIASAYGHVSVLEAWKELKSEKFAMSFDNQVLVGPTKNGFVRVLEWWKDQTRERGEAEGEAERQGPRLRVEYKTCDIEEALEDSVGSQGGEGEDEVRKWWAKNGLNLGVGTSEWMKVKVL